MNQSVATASNFRTTRGGKRVPVNVQTIPGIDEQLIKGEERAAKIKAAKPLMRALNRARASSAQPDIRQCVTGKHGCHLHIHDADNGRIITRGAICCIGC